MDFSLTGEARDLATLTRGLAASGRSLWPALAEAGVLAAALPKTAGGEGYGLIEQCAILVELGRAAATVPYLPSIVAAASTLARFGADEWVGPAGRGEVVLTAAPLGSVEARPDGTGWRLDGEVTAVPAATEAALILVPAGPDVFLVRPGDPGVTVEPQRVEGGPGAGLLRLDGAAGQPLEDAAGWLAAHATVGTCAMQLGVVERALEMTAGYARERVQFGRPIGSFQAVSQRLADAYIDVEALRLTLWQAVWLLTEERPAAAEVATAGFWAAEAGHRVLHAAVHIHGGVGLDVDYPLHRYFLAAKYHEFLLGGATTQLATLFPGEKG
ncbi:alkylation response protein AidB-like acyl-CoA dehydrogenase [Actinoplanes tereljensis]|uniref:Acyl-CoA dehydrogenase n=1 Tax=Paractinoplanes tereljensis TaxID=571912 RepID=A0A919NRQ2_9ACTN|nr:acyl-CoA dehydrogenase family protein [Actinoplanes tereljensis]GIF22784.1 acyl-CoA dehydrogenase [Actinoplanes tereljensis]